MDPVSPQPQLSRIFGSIFLIFTAVTLPGLEWSLFGWIHILIPLLIFFHLIKYGLNVGNKYIATAVGLAAVVGIFVQGPGPLLFTLSWIPAGYALARSGLRGDSPSFSGLQGAAVQAACWLLLIGGISIVTGESAYGSFVATFNALVDEALKQYRLNASLTADTLLVVEATLQKMKTVVPIILPALFLGCTLFTTWITMVLGNKLARRFCNREIWPLHRTWQLPDRLIWLVIISAIAAFLPLGPIRAIAANMLILLSIVYCFQGFAVCVFYMNKWNVPLLFRSFLYVMIVFQQLGTLLLLVVGVADTWFDFRKLAVPANTPDDNLTDE